MTPEQLGLTPEEYDALLWVRNCLDPEHPEQMPDWMVFDMDNWASQTSCGNPPGEPPMGDPNGSSVDNAAG